MHLLFPTKNMLDTATGDKPGESHVLRQSHLKRAVRNDSCLPLDVAREYPPHPLYDTSFLLPVIPTNIVHAPLQPPSTGGRQEWHLKTTTYSPRGHLISPLVTWQLLISHTGLCISVLGIGCDSIQNSSFSFCPTYSTTFP